MDYNYLNHNRLYVLHFINYTEMHTYTFYHTGETIFFIMPRTLEYNFTRDSSRENSDTNFLPSVFLSYLLIKISIFFSFLLNMRNQNG